MNEKVIDISRLIAEFIRDVEVKLDTIILNQYQKYKMGLPETWFSKQMSDLPNLTRKILTEAKFGRREAVQVVRKGMYLAYAFERDPKLFEKKIDEFNKSQTITLPKQVIDQVNVATVFALGAISLIGQRKITAYKKTVSVMYQKSIVSTEPAKTLLEEILRRTTKVVGDERYLKGLDGGSGVRKSLELGVRKSLQDITQLSFETSPFVFVLCSEHGDCAPDHKDWQGKVYFNENWREFVSNPKLVESIDGIIRKKRMRSYQWVKSEPVKMWVRWNCRHKLRNIPIEDVLEKPVKDILSENNFSTKGKYQAKKYNKLQEQRQMERNVRKYDERLQVMGGAGNPNPDDFQRNKILKNKWRKKLISLVKSNDVFLFRARDREKARKLMFDFGVKYRFREVV
jgi:hypothetical protein